MSRGIIRCNVGLLMCSFLFLLIVIIFISKSDRLKEYINKHFKRIFIIAFILAVLGRYFSIFLSFCIEKYINDFNLFVGWADIMIDTGLKGFTTEYPALYLYVLYGMRWVLRIFSLDNNYLITCLFMRTPAILCDLGIAYFIYKLAIKKVPKVNALLLSSMILFSPTFVINSSMWGQIDSILALALIASFYYLDNDKPIISVLFYFIGCMVKIQGIFFAPIYGMIYILPYIKRKKRLTISNIIKEFLVPIVMCVLIFILLTLPFKTSINQIWILDFFKHISTKHPQNTLGAFNLFGLFGGNHVSYLNGFLFLDYKTWGYIFIVVICIVCVYFTLRSTKHSIYLLGAFCICALFTLGVSMHERYILPLIPLMLIGYIYDNDKRFIYIAAIYTLLSWFDQDVILFRLFLNNSIAFKVASFISVAMFLGVLLFTIKKV